MRASPERLETLRRLAILDTEPEEIYEACTRSLADLLNVPITMVNMLDAERDWFKACVGLPIRESSAAASFCERFFETSENVIVVEDTRADARYSTSPFVLGAPFIRFYAGVRLAVDGHTVGTLCAYDTRVNHLTPQQIADMYSLAGAAIGALYARVPSGQ